MTQPDLGVMRNRMAADGHLFSELRCTNRTRAKLWTNRRSKCSLSRSQLPCSGALVGQIAFNHSKSALSGCGSRTFSSALAPMILADRVLHDRSGYEPPISWRI
jgi:hypothetical protein